MQCNDGGGSAVQCNTEVSVQCKAMQSMGAVSAVRCKTGCCHHTKLLGAISSTQQGAGRCQASRLCPGWAAKHGALEGVTVLHCIALYCIVLQHVALHCSTLPCGVLHRVALRCTQRIHAIASHCIISYCIAIGCIALCCITLHGLALRCTAFCYVVPHCIRLHCMA